MIRLRFAVFLIAFASLATAMLEQQQSNSKPGQAGEDDNPLAPYVNKTWFDTSRYVPHGNGVKLGRSISAPDPEYSETARQKKINGTVILAIAINASGTVDDVKVLQSVEPGLDQNAVYAVKQWKFTPATKDGKPVGVQIPVSVGFRLY